MKIIDNCIFTDGVHFKKHVIRRFKNNKIIPGIFVLRLANEPDQLEIIRADFLKQEMLQDDARPIVAFAAGYDDAVDLVVELTGKAIDKFGEPDLRAYFES